MDWIRQVSWWNVWMFNYLSFCTLGLTWGLDSFKIFCLFLPLKDLLVYHHSLIKFGWIWFLLWIVILLIAWLMIGARSIRLWVLIIFRSPKDLLTHLIGYLNDILPFKHRSSFFLNGTIVLFHVILSCLLVQGLLFLDDIIMVLQSNILFYNVIFQFRIIYFKVSFIFDG